MNRFHCRIESRAVTLVEVLVVTSIVMVLAALTFTIVRAAMEAAKKGACINNLKQQFAAVQIYEENVGFYPMTWEDLATVVPSARGLLICPNDPTKGYATNPYFGGTSSPRFNRSLSRMPPHSYAQSLFYAWWVANGKPDSLLVPNPVHADFSDPNLPIAWCDWHLHHFPPRDDQAGATLQLTVYNDGHVGWFQPKESEFKKWFPDNRVQGQGNSPN